MVSKSVVWLMLELAEIDPAVSIITMARTAVMRLSPDSAPQRLDVGARAEALAAEMLLDQDFGDLDGIDRLAVADEHRNAYAGRGHRDIRVEDLAGLGRHLPFFLGRAVVHEDVAL